MSALRAVFETPGTGIAFQVVSSIAIDAPRVTFGAKCASGGAPGTGFVRKLAR